MNTTDNTATLDPFEARLRADLHRLADHAPASVDLTVTNRATLSANEPAPGRGRRVASVGAIVAILAGGAGLTINGLQSASDPGGAASPDEAVQQFADAFANEDLLGMADITVPEEAKALRAAADDGIAQAQRLDLLSQSFRLDGVSGIDVEIEGLTLSDASIDDQLVAVTSTGGTMSLTVDPAALEIGEQSRQMTDEQVDASTTTVDLADQPITLVAQRRGEHWYVSAGMSIAENIVLATGGSTPADLGIVPEGSPSAQAAASSFYARLANLDLTGASALVAPGEGDVFRRYGGLWLPAAEEGIASAKVDGVSFAITTPIEYETVSDSDGRVVLKPVKYGFDFTQPEYEYTTVETFDPTLETIVTDDVKGGEYLLPAGAPMPATTDDPIFATAPFYSWSDEAAMNELYGDGSTEPMNRNYVWMNHDGTLEMPTESIQGDVIGTATVHVETADGCTTITLPENDALFEREGMPTMGLEEIDANTFRGCTGGESALNWLWGASLVSGAALLPELPTIVVTDNGGEWFVSPIGTIAEMLIGPMRDLPDDAQLFDNPIVAASAGLISRDEFNTMLASGEGYGSFDVNGNEVPGELSAECAAVTEAGPDGTPVLVADPDFAAYRACLDTFWMNYAAATSEEDASMVEASMVDDASEVVGTVPPEGSGG